MAELNENQEKAVRWFELFFKVELPKQRDALLNHFRETYKLALFGVVLVAVPLFIYMVVATLEIRSNPKAKTYSDLYWIVHWTTQIIFFISIMLWAFSGARMVAYGFIVSFGETVVLKVASVGYNIYSFVMLDAIEKAFDADKKIETAINEAIEEKALTQYAEKLVNHYFNAVRWMIAIAFLIQWLPLQVFMNPHAVFGSIIGIIFLIFAAMTWGSERFWMPIIQAAFTYGIAGFVIYNLVIAPFLRSNEELAATAQMELQTQLQAQTGGINLIQIGIGILVFLGIFFLILLVRTLLSRNYGRPGFTGGSATRRGKIAWGIPGTKYLPWFIVFCAALLIYLGGSTLWNGVMRLGTPPVLQQTSYNTSSPQSPAVVQTKNNTKKK